MEEDAPLVSFKKALVTAMEIVEDMDFPLPLYELFHLALKIPFNSETHTTQLSEITIDAKKQELLNLVEETKLDRKVQEWSATLGWVLQNFVRVEEPHPLLKLDLEVGELSRLSSEMFAASEIGLSPLQLTATLTDLPKRIFFSDARFLLTSEPHSCTTRGGGRLTEEELLDDLEMRSLVLLSRGIVCDCARCQWEKSGAGDLATLKDLMDFFVWQENWAEALKVSIALKDDWLTAKFLGYLSEFGRRERLLRKIAKVDERAAEAVLESDAYFRGPVTPSSSSWEGVYESKHGGSIHVAEGVLDAGECASLIDQTETFLGGKWTTARHYAVPTTDVALYKIPFLLAWYNLQLKQIIFPMLRKQFEIEENQQLRVFDSFLVKYDAAGGQRRLPLHDDQSVYSLTIALNRVSDYDGGGTFFLEPGEVCKTDVGGIVSFEGCCEHAGVAITKGIRYIIAAFLWAEPIACVGDTQCGEV